MGTLLLFCSYIKLYGRKFTKEDHVTFIKIFYELLTTPDLDAQFVIAFSNLLVQLLKYGFLVVHTHTHIHTYTHTYIHTYIYTYIHTYIHTHTHTHRDTYVHTHTYIHRYIHIHIYMYHVHICIYTVYI